MQLSKSTSANEHVDVMFKLHMHGKHSLPHSSHIQPGRSSQLQCGLQENMNMDMKCVMWLAWPWAYRHIKAMSKLVPPFSVMEEFGHSPTTTGMNRQTQKPHYQGKRSFHHPIFQPGLIMLRCRPRCMATTRFKLKAMRQQATYSCNLSPGQH